MHRDVRYYKDPIAGLPKVRPGPVNVQFHSRVLCDQQMYPAFCLTDLIVTPERFHFLNKEYL